MGAEASSEREGEVFFEKVVGEVSAGVGASVGGVEEDDGAGLLGVCGDARQEDEGEECGELSVGTGQDRSQGCLLIVFEA